MGNHHHRGPSLHAEAAAPTLSLLRLSALERLTASGVVLGVLWTLVYWVMA
jgi:hypothetical protein